MKLARVVAVLVGAAVLAVPAAASADLPTTNDPRFGLAPGFENPGTASSGMQLLVNRPKPASFTPPDGNPGNFGFLTSDMAFQDDYAFVGGFNGFQIWNIRNPAAPTLRTAVVCPGGQGDVSVYQNLLFMSVEETRARIDCGTQGVPPGSEAERFRGVRIFDISNLSNPVQVGGVQTCRGSHTHTLVTDKHDKRNVYIYVQGTAGPRPATELAGCDGNNGPDPVGDNPSKWRIEVIKVPVRDPEDAEIVNEPRLFANDAGAVNGLQNAVPTPLHPCASAPTPCGPGTGVTGGATWSPQPITDACHDITVYPEIGLAAGACEGNGLLIDIRDPENPRRIDAVADPNYAYWHGATFTNDGKHVVFTDEWGGGTTARCRTNDDLDWGGDSVYAIVRGKLQFRSYYKLPVAQTLQENCVSHIPSVIPVPGRDIMVQAFYQGGASLIDFSDPRNPVEIGYFDRGPVNGNSVPPVGPTPGGFWSTYWYNGEWYGSELARNLDVVALKPTAHLSKNEIAAAREVEVDRLNVQRQDKYRHDPSFAVVRSYRDQLVRSGDLGGKTLRKVDDAIDKAEHFADRGKNKSAAEQLEKAERELGRSHKYEDLRDALDDLADELDRKRKHHHHGWDD
jgi:LVIVD repeat